LFNEAGAQRGLASPIIEKDFWVCWTLKRLFALPGDNPSLVFKGGTSLSKVYGVIQRFSEDIDLSFDRRALGYEGERDPQAASGGKRDKLIDSLVADVRRHIHKVFIHRLAETMAAALGRNGSLWSLEIDVRDPLSRPVGERPRLLPQNEVDGSTRTVA